MYILCTISLSPVLLEKGKKRHRIVGPQWDRAGWGDLTPVLKVALTDQAEGRYIVATTPSPNCNNHCFQPHPLLFPPLPVKRSSWKELNWSAAAIATRAPPAATPIQPLRAKTPAHVYKQQVAVPLLLEERVLSVRETLEVVAAAATAGPVWRLENRKLAICRLTTQNGAR